jgi:exonuclease SbcC
MIRELAIRGFQIYKDRTVLKFHPGLNVIIGTTDSGKSSIVRSEKWLVKNRPTGDSFRNEFLEPDEIVYVANITEEKQKVTRQKSSNRNQYVLNGDVKNPLKALRQDSPDEVIDILKLGDVNIQSQHPNEQYFLLTDSPGVVAKKLNDVSGLSIIDKAMDEINKSIRSNNSTIKTIDGTISELEDEIKELDKVPLALKEALKIKDFQDGIIDLQYKADRLEELVNEINSFDLSQFDELDNAKKELNNVRLLQKKINELKRQQDSLLQVITVLNYVEVKLERYQSIAEAQNALKTLINESNEKEQLYDEIDIIEKLLVDISVYDSEIKDLDSDIDKYRKVFHNKLKTDGCPLCGSVLK